MQSTGKRLYIVGLSRQHVTVEVCVVYIEKFDKSASSEFLAEMPPAHGCGHVKCTNRGVYHSTASDTSSVVLCSFSALQVFTALVIFEGVVVTCIGQKMCLSLDCSLLKL